ncbi:MAG: ChaN family lipoprotein [Deltaproteobacteria bacterium]|nr:ChaN family lipoprotein [Deltaproteobacteria bacterium]
MNRTVLTVLIAVAAVIVSGCAGQLKSPTPEYNVDDIVDTKTGRVVAFDDLLAALTEVQVAFIGETHDQVSHHEIQLKIIRALLEVQADVVLGMEMFTYEVQPVLDAWTLGELDEETFLREVDWDAIWGYPYILYRDILDEARIWSLKVLGLNAPHDVIQRIARGGLKGLSPEDRSKVAEDIVLDLPDYRKYIRKQYTEHDQKDLENFEFFFQAQRAWDETMADTLAKHLLEIERTAKILVFAGAGHIYKGYGIPDSFKRRTGLPYVTIIPVEPGYAGEAVRDRIADYIWVARPSKLDHPRLGVRLDEAALAQGRLKVVEVMENSKAREIGIEVGDILESLNGVKLRTAGDVARAILDAGFGEAHHLRIDRQGLHLELVFTMDADRGNEGD